MRSFGKLVASVAAALLCIIIASPPLHAETYRWDYSSMGFRRENAANSYAQLPWNRTYPDQSGAFKDSTVFRVATAIGMDVAGGVDTSRVYLLSDFPPPPTFEDRGGMYGGRAQKVNSGAGPGAVGGATDSVTVDTTDGTRWISIRVQQDTTSYNNATVDELSSALDSIYVGAQYSYDGITWFNVQGTPTRAFTAVGPDASAIDGRQPPMLIGVELVEGADAAEVYLQYQPGLDAADPILNRTLCNAPSPMVRFLVAVGELGGQFKADIGHWSVVR